MAENLMSQPSREREDPHTTDRPAVEHRGGGKLHQDCLIRFGGDHLEAVSGAPRQVEEPRISSAISTFQHPRDPLNTSIVGFATARSIRLT